MRRAGETSKQVQVWQAVRKQVDADRRLEMAVGKQEAGLWLSAGR